MGKQVCSVCSEEKGLDLFYRKTQGANGRQKICKRCTRGRYANKKRSTESTRRSWKKRNRLHPEQIKATGKVKYALRTGKLVRPKNCSQCGEGKRLDGHHVDYSKPLEVIWLCRSCHIALHQSMGSYENNRRVDW